MNASINYQQIALSAIEKAFAPSIALLANEPSFCIYGAGATGRLLHKLCIEKNAHPAAYLDDLSSSKHLDGIPVLPVKEGIEKFDPTAILLGTIQTADRMRRNLEAVPYSGRILHTIDPNAHVRSPHCNFTLTPSDIIKKYRDCHKGQRAFILGNGPSLLKTDPRKLKNEVTFGANNIFLLDDFTPSYYAAIDRVLTQDRADEINALPGIKFFPHLVSEWITNGIFLNAIPAEWPTDFSTDISKFIEIDFTVTYSLMQIAFYMGCNPVYLIGVDHTYKVDMRQNHLDSSVLTSLGDDPNHFHPSYFGKGYRWHKPRMAPLEACYKTALAAYRKHGRQLYNATAGGALEVLPRVDFKTLT